MHGFMRGYARALAVLGGLVLTGLILLTCLSVLGREINGFLNGAFMQGAAPGFADWLVALGVGPINGDFEIVEAGVAFAIFAFMPLCQITAGHATVDVLTSKFSTRANRVLRLLAEALLAAVLILIAVQLFQGLGAKFRNGETSFLLQFPIWWAYALSFFGAASGAVVAIYVAWVRLSELTQDRTILPTDAGADP